MIENIKQNIKQNWKKYLLLILVTLGSYFGYNVTITPKETTTTVVPTTDSITVDTLKVDTLTTIDSVQ